MSTDVVAVGGDAQCNVGLDALARLQLTHVPGWRYAVKAHLRDGLRVDDLGDEALVLDPEGGKVHRVEGDAVAVLRLLTAGAGGSVDVPDVLRAGLDDLVDAGLVDPPASWSRRKVLMAGGAAWVAATVTTVGLADPAAASSLCPVGVTPTMGAQTYTASGSFTTGPAGGTMSMTTYSLSVSAWGGGGGGGGGSASQSGGGGGGGEYRGGNITVNECTTYTVTVGAGGSGGGDPGSNGTSSSFGSLLVAAGGMGGAQSAAGGAGGAGGTGGTGGTANFNGGTGGMGGDPGTYQGGGGGGGGAGTAQVGGAGGDGGGDGSSGGTVQGSAGTGGSTGGGAGGQGGRGVLLGNNGPAAGTVIGGGGGGGGQAGLGHTGGMGARGEVRVG